MKDIDFHCKICNEHLLTTDTSKGMARIGAQMGQALYSHLESNHPEAYEIVGKRSMEIMFEYILPTSDEIKKIFKDEELK